jgi:hypothetical protein
VEIAQVVHDDLPPRGDDDQIVQIRKLSQSRGVQRAALRYPGAADNE